MNKRTKRKIINGMMFISLIVVFASGFLLRPFSGMFMGITHTVSGSLLFISAMIHILQHRKSH